MGYITNETMLLLITRVILGILFFFQGYDKVFNMGVKGVISFFRQETEGRKVPDIILTTSAFFTSYVELIGGGLLIIGLFKSWSLYLLGIDLVLVAGAFSMLKPMWDMQQLFPRLVLLALLLYLPSSWDVFSIDHFIGSLNGK